MARIIKKTRIARNPRRRLRLPRNSKGRFLKRSAVRRKRTHKRARNVAKRRTVRRSNPPILIELGAINPRRTKRRSNSMAKRRTRRKVNVRRRRRTARAVNPRRRRRVHRRRRNAVVVVAPRRRRRSRAANPRRRRRVHARSRNPRRRRYGRRHHRRNPSGRSLLEMTGGVLVGVAATKYLPTLIPQSIKDMIPGAGGLGGVAISIAGAFAAQWISKKVLGPTYNTFSDHVLAGGLAMAGSQALNMFAPPALTQALALSGMGDIVPGYFPVPQNPVTSRQQVAVMPTGTSGLGRAFRPALGRGR